MKNPTIVTITAIAILFGLTPAQAQYGQTPGTNNNYEYQTGRNMYDQRQNFNNQGSQFVQADQNAGPQYGYQYPGNNQQTTGQGQGGAGTSRQGAGQGYGPNQPDNRGQNAAPTGSQGGNTNRSGQNIQNYQGQYTSGGGYQGNQNDQRSQGNQQQPAGWGIVRSVDQPENCMRLRRAPSSSTEQVGCAGLGERLPLNGNWSGDGRWVQTMDGAWAFAGQIQTDLKSPRAARPTGGGYSAAAPQRERVIVHDERSSGNYTDTGIVYGGPYWGKGFVGFGYGWRR